MIRVIFISLVTVLHLEHSHTWSLADKKNPVCLNPECRKFADYILNNMDKRVDPCKDFYGYVCNGWEKSHPRPKYEMKWNVGRYMRQQAFEKIRGILENPKESVNPKVREAKMLYKICNNIPYMEMSDRDTVRKTVLGIQDWPKFMCNNEDLPDDLSLWTIDSYYFERTGESALFGVSIQLISSAEYKIAVHFHAPLTVYGALERVAKWRESEKENYKLFLVTIVESMMPKNLKYSKENIDRIVKRVFRFREDLTEIANNIDSDKHEAMTVEETQHWYNQLIKKFPNARMNWMEYLRVMRRSHKGSHGYTIRDDEVIYVQKKYFVKLCEVLARTTPSVIVNHIHLFFVEKHILPTPEMKKLLQRSLTQSLFNDPPTAVIRLHPERWQNCIETHGMKETLARLYIESYFPISSKAEVEKLIDDAKELLQVQIFSSSWLDLQTKKMSKRKIDTVRSIAGYPDWLHPLVSRTKRNEPVILPFEVDVAYMEEFNIVYATAAYLQIPVFLPNLPYVVNYGATTSMLGHELYHLVDEQGIYIDERQKIPWWNSEMVIQYMKRSTCFLDLYTKLKGRELNKHGLRVAIDGSISLDEDIGDAMGLKLAYSGYKLQRLKNDGVCSILPGFEKHGCDQLFFISFGNAFCEALADKDLRGLYKYRHTAVKVRVNGAVSNMKEFSEAFKCKKGDHMYVEKSCDIWQK